MTGLVTGSGGEAIFCVGSCSGEVPPTDATLTVVIHTVEFAEEITWNIDGGVVFGEQPQFESGMVYEEELTLPAGEHTIYYFDAYGDGWHGGYFEIVNCGETIAGGAVDGLVEGAGGEKIFVASTCGGTVEASPVLVLVTLDTDMRTVDRNRAQFESDFQHDVAHEFGITPASIVITGIVEGSVVVSCAIIGIAESDIAQLEQATIAGFQTLAVAAADASTPPPPAVIALTMSFLADYSDTSNNGRVATLSGDTHVETDGAHFDGSADDIMVANFPYAQNDMFTVSFWFTKEECTGGIYEYLYSHHHDDGPNTWENPYVDIYLACEESGGGASTAGGSIVRYWLRDGAGSEASMDYSLHDAGAFDSITNSWVHTVLSVAPTSLVRFDSSSGCLRCKMVT